MTEHGVGFVDRVGIECLCRATFSFEAGRGWLDFNDHLRRLPADPSGLREALDAHHNAHPVKWADGPGWLWRCDCGQRDDGPFEDHEAARQAAVTHIEQAVRAALAAQPEDRPRPEALCWFCKRSVPVDALIAGYDSWEEQRLACLACNERMSGNWKPALDLAAQPEDRK